MLVMAAGETWRGVEFATKTSSSERSLRVWREQPLPPLAGWAQAPPRSPGGFARGPGGLAARTRAPSLPAGPQRSCLLRFG